MRGRPTSWASARLCASSAGGAPRLAPHSSPRTARRPVSPSPASEWPPPPAWMVQEPPVSLPSRLPRPLATYPSQSAQKQLSEPSVRRRHLAASHPPSFPGELDTPHCPPTSPAWQDGAPPAFAPPAPHFSQSAATISASLWFLGHDKLICPSGPSHLLDSFWNILFLACVLLHG